MSECGPIAVARWQSLENALEAFMNVVEALTVLDAGLYCKNLSVNTHVVRFD
jgi:hypothetical protein